MLVVLAPPRQMGLCTSFLIGNSLLVTNSHCLPEDLKATGTSCAGRIWANFPASGSYPASCRAAEPRLSRLNNVLPMLRSS